MLVDKQFWTQISLLLGEKADLVPNLLPCQILVKRQQFRIKSLPATGPHITDGNVSTTDVRLTADPGVQEFDPGQVTYFCGD